MPALLGPRRRPCDPPSLPLSDVARDVRRAGRAPYFLSVAGANPRAAEIGAEVRPPFVHRKKADPGRCPREPPTRPGKSAVPITRFGTARAARARPRSAPQ